MRARLEGGKKGKHEREGECERENNQKGRTRRLDQRRSN